jgi:hypothetical protein
MNVEIHPLPPQKKLYNANVLQRDYHKLYDHSRIIQ